MELIAGSNLSKTKKVNPSCKVEKVLLKNYWL